MEWLTFSQRTKREEKYFMAALTSRTARTAHTIWQLSLFDKHTHHSLVHPMTWCLSICANASASARVCLMFTLWSIFLHFFWPWLAFSAAQFIIILFLLFTFYIKKIQLHSSCSLWVHVNSEHAFLYRFLCRHRTHTPNNKNKIIIMCGEEREGERARKIEEESQHRRRWQPSNDNYTELNDCALLHSFDFNTYSGRTMHLEWRPFEWIHIEFIVRCINMD